MTRVGERTRCETYPDSAPTTAVASRVLVCDGAMGTMLHAGGVSLDRSLPELNLSHPDLVRSIHRAYIAAGAQVVETEYLRRKSVQAGAPWSRRSHRRNQPAGVRLARAAAERHPDVLIAGSVGPATPAGLGHRLTTRQLRDAFREQIGALVEEGMDLLLLETFGSLHEMVDAVSVAQSLGDVPIVGADDVRRGRPHARRRHA